MEDGLMESWVYKRFQWSLELVSCWMFCNPTNQVKRWRLQWQLWCSFVLHTTGIMRLRWCAFPGEKHLECQGSEMGCIFAWTTSRGKILLVITLWREDLLWLNDATCVGKVGRLKHLLLHMILEFCLLYVGIHWVMPRSAIDLFFGWRNWFGKHPSFIWNLTPMLVMDTGERGIVVHLKIWKPWWINWSHLS